MIQKYATQQKNDMEQILSIYNHVILHTTAVYDYQPHTLQMRLSWFETRTQQGFPVFVAEEGEEILGFGSFWFFFVKRKRINIRLKILCM